MYRLQARKKIILLLAALLLLSGLTAYPFRAVPAYAAGEFELRILHTNDTHAHLDNVARRVTAIREARNDRTLLLDAGDVFSGTLYFNQYNGIADLHFMNELSYDAMTFGNHEFDKGPATLAEFVKQATFPFVSANIDFSRNAELSGMYRNEVGEPAAPGHIYPAIVEEIDGERVGIFGLTTNDTVSLSSPGEDIAFKDHTDSARAAVELLQSKDVNKIIAVSHLGYEVDRQVADEVQGIDIIVGGHSHTRLDEPVVFHEDGEPTLIVQTGEYGAYLGQLDVAFDENGVLTDWTGQLAAVDAQDEEGNYVIAEDPESAAKLAEYAAPLEELKQTAVGESAVRLNGDRETVRAQETNLGDLMTDGMRAKVMTLVRDDEAAGYVTIQNSGGIRASLEAGDITLGDLLTVMPFGNNLTALKMTGEEIVAALENGVSGVESGEGRFPQVSGLRFYYDSTKPGEQLDPISGEVTQEGERIVKVQVKTEDGAYVDLDPNAYYIVATNSFMADGGDFYRSMRAAKDDGRHYELNLVDYEIFREYLEQVGAVDIAAEGRIVDLQGGALPAEAGGTSSDAGAGEGAGTSETSASFADISADPNADAIREAADRSIVLGYEDGLFRPDEAVTRAELAVLLSRALGTANAAGGAASFADAGDIPAWAAPAVAQLTEQGLMDGYADNTFRPDERLTRAEAIVIVAEAAGLSADAAAAELPFADAAAIPASAVPAVAAAYEAGIVSGERFEPNAFATRSDVVGWLVGAIR